ncbi:MAG: alpha/beta hydrolase [Anaerolineae bacterium]|nr:alpha/beta hydrolase [Anaerolineae bacterium]
MSQWQSGDAIANGVRIHYHRTGGARPPVLLLHGITDNGLCWTRLVRALEPDYDCIMVDARGHGLSEAPASGYAPLDHAADVAGLIGALDLVKPVLIGHSMGAATAAVTAGGWPERVGAVVLEDPPWFAEPPMPADPDAALEEWRAGMAANKAKTVEELVALCREQSPSWDEIEWLPWAESKRQVDVRVIGFAAGWSTPWQEVARQITCPTLLVTADPEAGAIVTPEVAREAAELMRDCRVARIAGAGHNVRREQFEQYLAVVSAFLREVAG